MSSFSSITTTLGTAVVNYTTETGYSIGIPDVVSDGAGFLVTYQEVDQSSRVVYAYAQEVATNGTLDGDPCS